MVGTRGVAPRAMASRVGARGPRWSAQQRGQAVVLSTDRGVATCLAAQTQRMGGSVCSVGRTLHRTQIRATPVARGLHLWMLWCRVPCLLVQGLTWIMRWQQKISVNWQSTNCQKVKVRGRLWTFWNRLTSKHANDRTAQLRAGWGAREAVGCGCMPRGMEQPRVGPTQLPTTEQRARITGELETYLLEAVGCGQQSRPPILQATTEVVSATSVGLAGKWLRRYLKEQKVLTAAGEVLWGWAAQQSIAGWLQLTGGRPQTGSGPPLEGWRVQAVEMGGWGVEVQGSLDNKKG